MTLVIRDAQMRAMQDAFDDEYVRRVLPLLWRAHPDECAALGAPGVRALARDGLERSGRYGITTEANVYRFVELMLLLGERFDADPALPWAADVLTAAGFRDENERVEVLLDEARAHLDDGS